MPILFDTMALLPVKSLDTGKTRLSPMLTPAERAELIPAMVEDIFDAFAEFGQTRRVRWGAVKFDGLGEVTLDEGGW